MKADDGEMSRANKKIFITDRSASSSMSTRDILVRLRIPYEQNYKRKHHRTTETLRFWDIRAIVIREVAPEAAPLAYRISEMNPLSGMDRCSGDYALREFEGGLWWPVMFKQEFLDLSQFERGAAEGDEGILLLLDPKLQPVRMHPITAEEFFGKVEARQTGSDLESRWLLAQDAATRTILCDGRIHVRGESPIFYVVHRQVKGGFELMVGEAGLTRRETPQCRILGPTWGERAGSAFDSLAFGIEEVEAAVAGLLRRGFSLFGRPCVEPLIPSHDPGQAALLCSQAITAYFWRLSEWNKKFLPLHCRNLPAMAATFDPTARVEDVCHVELLEQFLASREKEFVGHYYRWLPNAADILRRLESLGRGRMAEEDEAALAALGA